MPPEPIEDELIRTKSPPPLASEVVPEEEAAPADEAVEVEEANSAEQPGLEPAPSMPGATAALNAALESLGQAHHRPYSRA